MGHRGAAATIASPLPTSDGPSGRSTVVVGFDGSETSWRALWWACGEAQRLSGRVIAVYVTCTADTALATAALAAGFDAGTSTTAADLARAQRAAELQAEIHRHTIDLGIEIDFRHLHGDTAEQLLQAAYHAHADLIAVGRSTKLRHRLAGSLARRLTCHRKAPIVVVVP